MIVSATPRVIFGIAGALLVSALLLAPYDFAAAARTLVSVIQDQGIQVRPG